MSSACFRASALLAPLNSAMYSIFDSLSLMLFPLCFHLGPLPPCLRALARERPTRFAHARISALLPPRSIRPIRHLQHQSRPASRHHAWHISVPSLNARPLVFKALERWNGDVPRMVTGSGTDRKSTRL